VEASGSRQFQRIYQTFPLEVAFSPYIFGDDRDIAEYEQRIQKTGEAHRQLLETIRLGQTERARELAAEHVVTAKEGFLRRTLPRLAKQGEVQWSQRFAQATLVSDRSF
jgi:DNA-binding GntR family transcriptional regulator